MILSSFYANFLLMNLYLKGIEENKTFYNVKRRRLQVVFQCFRSQAKKNKETKRKQKQKQKGKETETKTETRFDWLDFL
jgi:hypothetical protein